MPQIASRHMRAPGACRCGSNEMIFVFSFNTVYACNCWFSFIARMSMSSPVRRGPGPTVCRSAHTLSAGT